MIRLAIVGTGIIVGDHLKAISEIDRLQLTALCDINIDAAKKYADEYKVPYWTDYKKMADEIEFDAVILNLPHFLHCEASVFFLERGIHVLCEKPMANTVEECDLMLDAAKRSGAKLAIGHVQRFFGANEIVKKIVDSKELGELCMTSEVRNIFYFAPARPKWFLQKKLSGGGILMNYGAHALDKLLYIIGGDFTNIHGSCGNLLEGYDVEGHAQVKFTVGDKVSSTMSFCGYPSFSEYTTYYTFSNGALKVEGSNGLYIAKNYGAFEKYEFTESMSPYEKQLREFVKYINGEESLIPTGEYSRKIIKAICEIYSQNE